MSLRLPLTLAALALLLTACGDDGGGAVGPGDGGSDDVPAAAGDPDVPAAGDPDAGGEGASDAAAGPSDVVEAPDAPGEPDTPGEPDVADEQDVTDELDVADPPDVADQPDTADTPDVGDEPDVTDPPDEVDLAGPCPLDARWGGFAIEAHDMFSWIDGAVADGVNPITVLEQTLVAGDCRLLKRNNPFCDPPCTAGQTCDHDGTCIEFPLNQDLGTVTIDGLVQPVVLEPLQPSNTYFSTSLPHPAFEPLSPVTMTTAPDGFFGGQELHGFGVHLLVIADETQWDIEEGVSLDITWAPPPADAGEVRSHIAVTINIDQHGNSPLNLVCAFEDTGSATVPAETLDELLSAGISGYPNGTIIRRTVDSASLGEGGCMELIVASPRTPDVRVAGHTPCKSDLDCPSGQTCNKAIETCQ